jgi:hypothetical protein
MKLILGVIFAGCLFSAGAFAEQITGYISDAHCGAKHSTVSKANTQCIDMCLKGGSEPVLVRNGQVLKFASDSQKEAAAHAGQDVTINGTITDDTVTISSIKKAK